MSYPELEEIKKGKWSDAKRFLAEDIIAYSILLAGSLLLDPFLNLFYRVFNPEISHPVHYGVLQIGAIILSLIQLARAWDRWRYHA